MSAIDDATADLLSLRSLPQALVGRDIIIPLVRDDGIHFNPYTYALFSATHDQPPPLR